MGARFMGLLGLLALALAPAAACAFPWPNGARAAIVLTYDDSLRSQLDIAVPQLDAAGLKGSFFLNGTMPLEAVESWRAVAASGHELGNHSLFHPCPAASFPADPRYHAENYTVATMIREIGVMNAFLHAVDGRKLRNYGVPCSQDRVGGQDYMPALKASGLIRYTRTGDSGEGIIADPARVDIFAVPSRSFTERNGADDLIGHAEAVRRTGGMGVYMFHGVGGDYIAVTGEAHQALVRWLAEHRKEIWVAPFGEVMDWVTKQRGEASGK